MHWQKKACVLWCLPRYEDKGTRLSIRKIPLVLNGGPGAMTTSRTGLLTHFLEGIVQVT